MKEERQETLLDIVRTKAIETQEELQECLAERGYVVTQATISRDIKELSLVKKVVDGSSRYVVEKPTEFRYTESIVSVEAAQNIVVVKTRSGLAMAVCTHMDNMEISGNVGTLAGDDTCILIMTDNDTAKKFVEEMTALL